MKRDIVKLMQYKLENDIEITDAEHAEMTELLERIQVALEDDMASLKRKQKTFNVASDIMAALFLIAFVVIVGAILQAIFA